MTQAQIIKVSDRFILHWKDSIERAGSIHSTEMDAVESYYIRRACDYWGSAINKFTREEQIRLGLQIEVCGIDEDGIQLDEEMSQAA